MNNYGLALILLMFEAFLNFCSKDAVTAVSTVTTCSGFYDQNSSNCYVLHNDVPLSWQDASRSCSSYGTGSKLVTIKSEYESAIIQSYLMNKTINSTIWIGGQRESLYGQSFLWRWTRDKTAIAAQGCYRDDVTSRDLSYNVSNLVPSVTVDDCLKACHKARYNYAGLQAGTQCYCGNEYGLYGSVDTAYESNSCDSPCRGNNSQMCGSDLKNFIYNVSGVFSIWGFVRPNNWYGYQTCAILSDDVSHKMDDEDCGKPASAYICDIPLANCVNGAQLINGACYYISPRSTRVTWFVARMYCLSRGGDLLKISSLEVWNDLVATMGTSTAHYWIGLAGLYWNWNDGSEITYSNWYHESANAGKYQPSSIANRCILIDPLSDYQWVDGNCDGKHYYICKQATSGVKKKPPTVDSTINNSNSVPDSDSRKSGTGVETATAVLIAVCCLLLVAIVTLGVVFYLYRKQHRLNKIHSVYSPHEDSDTISEEHSPDLYNGDRVPVIAPPPRSTTAFDFSIQQH